MEIHSIIYHSTECLVPIEILWKEMENTDINPVLIDTAINLYEKNITGIKIDSKLTEEFQTKKGLRQEC
jgi:hypothetical protein